MSWQTRRRLGLALVLAGLSCSLATAQTPADEQMMAWQRGINASRDVRLRALAPQLMPDCAIKASAADMTAFFVYWRGLVERERALRRESGRPEEDTSPTALLPGMTIIPSVPLAEMATVGEKTPGAEDVARKEIEIWHIYRCAVQRFGSQKYFAHYGFDGPPWPEGVNATLEFDPGRRSSMMAPDAEILEPLDALGRFFRAAQASGALSFVNVAEEQYFFERYESAYFVNVTRSGKTDAWFDTPPWLTGNAP